jgi:hypothetical protein
MVSSELPCAGTPAELGVAYGVPGTHQPLEHRRATATPRPIDLTAAPPLTPPAAPTRGNSMLIHGGSVLRRYGDQLRSCIDTIRVFSTSSGKPASDGLPRTTFLIERATGNPIGTDAGHPRRCNSKWGVRSIFAESRWP